MQPKRLNAPARHLLALAIGTLAVTVMSFFALRFTRAAGEPTLTISLDDTNLTSGETATVTFAFSATPFNFDNSDVDLADASGALGTVTATADDRVYTAVFTPDPGVNDPTNTIVVGTQWNDSGGVSPLAPTSSPNYSVQTGTTSGGSGGCPAPSITLDRPNGGETLAAGSSVDVLWNMNGCQATSVQLLLSSDGGATYAVTGESPQPTGGFYRWTVPDAPSTSSRLQLKLLGSGGTELASDVSDGAFTITPKPTPPAPAPAPAAATSTPPAPPPSPPPQPDPSGTPPAPTSVDPTTPSATTTPAAAPTPTPAPATVKPPRSPSPAAPPMPNIPVPLAATPPAPATSTPIDPAMNTAAQNPTPAPMPVTLDSMQNAVETAADFAPSSVELAFSFLAGALGMLALVLGLQAMAKRVKMRNTQPCHTCRGTGTEPKAPQKCDACDGTGQVEDEDEPDIECPHCKGEGEDPCHVCKGSGKNAAGEECPACKGEGKTLTGKKDEDGEDEIAECEICHGEGEVSPTVKRMVKCDKCGGTGKL